MNRYCRTKFRLLEGRRVSVALKNGSRIDDSQLVSAGRDRAPTVWLFNNNADIFIPVDEVVDLWEVVPLARSRAA